MKTYEDCKKQVAEKHEFKSWEQLVWICYDCSPIAFDKYYAEAAELYMQAKSNEAVKEDRWQIQSNRVAYFITCSDGSIDIKDAFKKKPLPYPDEK